MSSKEYLGLSVSEWLGLGSAAASMALLFWKRIGAKIVGTAWDMVAAPARISELRELVNYELRPNSGGSLHDLVKQGVNEVGLLRRDVAKMRIGFARLEIGQQIALSEMAVPVWESDAEGLCNWINDTFTRETGWQLSDIQGNNWIENIIHQEDRAIVTRAWDDSIKGHRMFRLTYRWRTKAGVTLLVEAKTKPVVTDTGEVTGFFGMARILERA